MAGQALWPIRCPLCGVPQRAGREQVAQAVWGQTEVKHEWGHFLFKLVWALFHYSVTDIKQVNLLGFCGFGFFFFNHQPPSAGLCTDKVDLLLRGRVCVSGFLGGTCCQLFPLLILLCIFPHWSCNLEDAQQDHSILAAGISFWQFNDFFECCYRSYWTCTFPFNSSGACEQVTHGFASSRA